MIARHRLDADGARMLQAFNESGVDVEFAAAAQFRTVRIRNWHRDALIDPDRERAVEQALRQRHAQSAIAGFVALGSGLFNDGRETLVEGPRFDRRRSAADGE